LKTIHGLEEIIRTTTNEEQRAAAVTMLNQMKETYETALAQRWPLLSTHNQVTQFKNMYMSPHRVNDIKTQIAEKEIAMQQQSAVTATLTDELKNLRNDLKSLLDGARRISGIPATAGQSLHTTMRELEDIINNVDTAADVKRQAEMQYAAIKHTLARLEQLETSITQAQTAAAAMMQERKLLNAAQRDYYLGNQAYILGQKAFDENPKFLNQLKNQRRPWFLRNFLGRTVPRRLIPLAGYGLGF
jgi:hypothetical protein